MKKNFFIAIEGIDGSGKSTQIKLLKENFENAGYKVYTTFEPTGSEIGKIIRNIFSNRMEADHKTIAALFVADRLHHLLNSTDGIIKKLNEVKSRKDDIEYDQIRHYSRLRCQENNRINKGYFRPR